MQELMGHSELETTAKYLHSDTRTKQAAVGKLNGLLGGPDSPHPASGEPDDGAAPAGEPEPGGSVSGTQESE